MTQTLLSKRRPMAGATAGTVPIGTIAMRGRNALMATLEAPNDVRPDGVAALRRSGLDPYQVLMFGDGILTGVGLRDHNLGLPGRVADAIAVTTGRGVDVDVFVDGDPTSPTGLAGLRALRLQRYDAVVVVLGPTNISRPRAHHWEAELTALAGLLDSEGAASAALCVVDSSQADRPARGAARWLQRGLGADQLGAAIQSVREQPGRVHFAALGPARAEQSAFGRISDATYSAWADVLVREMLDTPTEAPTHSLAESAAAFRSRPDEEEPRRAALRNLGVDRATDDRFLDTLVQQLKRMYGVDSAAVNLLDGDELWALATTDPEAEDIPQAETICDVVIRSDGPLLVNDIREDPRFRDLPVVLARDLRFYAGYPIRTWDGHRVGAICVLDRAPRSLDRSELVGLRDFAGRVEQHLWQAALRN